MNPFVSQLMSYIPERTARVQTGTAFASVEATVCTHPERFALIAQHLDWLTPLKRLTREEQVRLGLRAPSGRSINEEAMAAEAEAEMEAESELEPEMTAEPELDSEVEIEAEMEGEEEALV